MQRLFLLLIAATSIALVTGFFKNNKLHLPVHAPSVSHNKTPGETERLKTFSSNLLLYAKQHGYNSNYAFLIDMKLPSGGNRFFIYDLKNDSVINAGLVTHGSAVDHSDEIVFSNKAGSNCSSLGRYKIGAPYYGKFGLAYKLYGLDSSNSNAFNRFVVLHSHACVPENEVLPQRICESWGCPTVAPGFLTGLKTYINNAQKPILLQIFY